MRAQASAPGLVPGKEPASGQGQNSQAGAENLSTLSCGGIRIFGIIVSGTCLDFAALYCRNLFEASESVRDTLSERAGPYREGGPKKVLCSFAE